MNKTKIDWCDYSWNPITGCLNGCKYCYARSIYHRFHKDFTPQIHYDRLSQPLKCKKPSKIFVCSVSDFWGRGVEPKWRDEVYNVIKATPEHTYLILTKQAQNITNEDRIPDNVWIGQTVIKKSDYKPFPKTEHIKFISFEPLLDNEIGIYRFPANWYIIGGLTPSPCHTKDGVNKILSQAEYFGIPVFIKDNTRYPEKRREFPPNHKE